MQQHGRSETGDRSGQGTCHDDDAHTLLALAGLGQPGRCGDQGVAVGHRSDTGEEQEWPRLTCAPGTCTCHRLPDAVHQSDHADCAS